MEPKKANFKFIKRVDATQYVADQEVSIGAGGGTDTVTNIPLPADSAIEVELDDGSVYVLLAYARK